MSAELIIGWNLSMRADVAWFHLADFERLPEWLGQPTWVADGVIDVDHGDGYVCRSEVARCDPHDRVLAVSWKFPDEPETSVTFNIESRVGGSRLVLRHTGLGSLANEYRVGWQTHLTYFAASLAGEPLDMADFWNVHATIANLGGNRAR